MRQLPMVLNRRTEIHGMGICLGAVIERRSRSMVVHSATYQYKETICKLISALKSLEVFPTYLLCSTFQVLHDAGVYPHEDANPTDSVSFTVGGFSVFAPQFLQYTYGMKQGSANLIFGGITAFTGLVGTAAGGWLLEQRKSGPKATAAEAAELACLLMLVSLPLCFLAFLVDSQQLFLLLLGLGELIIFAKEGPVNSAMLWSVGDELKPHAMDFSMLLGHLFESLVTLGVRGFAQAAEARVRHLRLQGGTHEVDLIIERADQRIVAIEIKLSGTVNKNDVKHLLWLREKIGDDLLDAVVVHTGPQAYRREDGIAVVPAALLGA